MPADIPQLLPLIAEHAAFEAASFTADAKFTERLAAAAFGAEPRVPGAPVLVQHPQRRVPVGAVQIVVDTAGRLRMSRCSR